MSKDLVVRAIELGNIEISNRVASALETMNLHNPDYTITEAVVTEAWGSWQAKVGGNNGGFNVDWTTVSVGCGRTTFYLNKEDGKLHCENQGMNVEFVMSVLKNVVDNCIMDT